jgi:ABC-type glycerol-3-phosphate transport system permease component
MSVLSDAGQMHEARGIHSRQLRRSPGLVVGHIALLVVGLLFVAPFYWMILSSVRPLEETLQFPVQLLTSRLTLDNYLSLLAKTNFARTLLNSVIIAFITAAASSFLCSLAGYAFALLRFRGRDLLFACVLGTMLIPLTVQMIPNFFLFSKLGLLDTWWTLILPSVAPAIGIFWMRQYVGASVPSELVDAARVDGCGEFGIFWRVIVPIIRPGIAALAIFITVLSWNDFVLPFLYLKTPDSLTFPARLVQFIPQAGQMRTPYDLMMAASVLSALPMLLLYLGLQRQFVAGITLGSGR